jgi:hypothetical protein
MARLPQAPQILRDRSQLGSSRVRSSSIPCGAGGSNPQVTHHGFDLKSTGSTKMTAILPQFEGGDEPPNLDSIRGPWQAQSRIQRYRRGEAMMASLGTMAPTMQEICRDTK